MKPQKYYESLLADINNRYGIYSWTRSKIILGLLNLLNNIADDKYDADVQMWENSPLYQSKSGLLLRFIMNEMYSLYKDNGLPSMQIQHSEEMNNKKKVLESQQVQFSENERTLLEKLQEVGTMMKEASLKSHESGEQQYLQKLQLEIDAKKKMLENEYRNELSKKDSQLVKLEQTLACLFSQYEKINEENILLREELKTLEELSVLTEEEKKKKIDALRKESDKVRMQNEDLRAERIGFIENMAKQEKDIWKEINKSIGLQSKLDEALDKADMADLKKSEALRSLNEEKQRGIENTTKMDNMAKKLEITGMESEDLRARLQANSEALNRLRKEKQEGDEKTPKKIEQISKENKEKGNVPTHKKALSSASPFILPKPQPPKDFIKKNIEKVSKLKIAEDEKNKKSTEETPKQKTSSDKK